MEEGEVKASGWGAEMRKKASNIIIEGIGRRKNQGEKKEN